MSLVIRKNLFPSPLFSHYQKSGEATVSTFEWKL